VYLNTRVAIDQFLKQKTDTSFRKKPWKNSIYFKHINDPKELGIDAFSDLAFVVHGHYQYVLLPLSSAEDFENSLKNSVKGLYGSISDKGHYHQVSSISGGFEVVWNDRLAAIVKKDKNIKADRYNVVLEVAKNNSFAQSRAYQFCKSDKSLVWFYSSKNHLQDLTETPMKGTIEYNKGIDIQMTTLQSSGIQNPEIKQYLNIKGNVLYSAGEGNYKIDKELMKFLNINLNSKAKDVFTKDLKNEKKLLFFDGKKGIERRFITYEYDDNFNKKIIENKIIDSVKSCAFVYSYKNSKHCVSNFDFNDSLILDQIPQNVKVYCSFDQDLLNSLLPLKLKYKVRALRIVQSGVDLWSIRIEPGDLKTLVF
ncbi:MAG TPA: hypothetical protein VGF79_09430, partial [Bacteroidia bacterium]